MDDILEFKNVSLTYQSDLLETMALKDLSFTVKNGEFVSIIGPSGCGKTTVLSLIAGLIKQTDGQILYKGKIMLLRHLLLIVYQMMKDLYLYVCVKMLCL